MAPIHKIYVWVLILFSITNRKKLILLCKKMYFNVTIDDEENDFHKKRFFSLYFIFFEIIDGKYNFKMHLAVYYFRII